MIEKDLEVLSKIPNLEANEPLKENAAFLRNEITHLESIQARDRKDDTRAALSNQGERLGGPWSAINKERKQEIYYTIWKCQAQTQKDTNKTPGEW